MALFHQIEQTASAAERSGSPVTRKSVTPGNAVTKPGNAVTERDLEQGNAVTLLLARVEALEGTVLVLREQIRQVSEKTEHLAGHAPRQRAGKSRADIQRAYRQRKRESA